MTDANNQADLTAAELHLADKLRPIRLALKVAESLLSRGVSTRDTVSQALDITEKYCKERVYFDVSSTVITASQYRGLYKDPLTLMVTVRYDASNNLIVQELQQLVRDIVAKDVPLESAIERYDAIEAEARRYPNWLRTLGMAGMATGIVMLFTHSWINMLLTFITAGLVEIFIRKIEIRKVPVFFIQALAALLIVLVVGLVGGLGRLDVWPFYLANPTLITVGSMMTLVAGLSLAATAQDAIDEYYVTASARFVKTAMLTVGIIIGIVGGLTLLNQLTGLSIVTEKSPSLSPFLVQVAGAALTGAAWALYTQSSKAAIFWAGAISTLAYLIYTSFDPSFGVVAASGIASFAIGLTGSIVARFSKSPSIAIINAAIVILVPGYMLYRGLMHFVGGATDAEFLIGSMTVVSAVMVALAISAGAALGTYIGRPIRSHIVRLYKYAPQLFVRPPAKAAKKPKSK